MREFTLTPRGVRIAMVVAALATVAWVGWLARGALFPFLVGAVIAYVIAPLVERLAGIQPWYARKPELARGISVISIYGGVLVALGVLGIFFIPDAIDEVDHFVDQIPDIADEAQAQFDEWVERYEDEVPPDVRERINEALSNASDEAGQLVESTVTHSLGLVFSTVSAILGYIAVPFFVFYALKDRDQALGRFYSFFPPSIQPDVRECVRIANHVLGAYVRAQLLLGVLIFSLTYIGLALMGVEFALPLAVFAGFTELIPIIGPIIGFVPAFIVVLATEPEKWWWIVVFYLGVQASENYLLVPRIHGESVHMHPALVLVLLTIGGALFGLWGVLLVVPISAAVRDVFSYIYRRLQEEERARKAAADPGPAASP